VHMDVVTVLVEAQQILIAQTPQLLEMVVCQEEEVAEGEVPLTLVALEQEAQEGTEEEAKLECGFINMSGLIQINQAGNSGIAGNPIDFQRFTTTGSNLTWTKPPHAKIVWIETIGAGGSGGTDAGSGGGGGGAFAWACFSAAALESTMTIRVGAGGDVGSTAGDGEAGEASTVTNDSKIILQAFGGGQGKQGAGHPDNGGGGGGGGGTASVGQYGLNAQNRGHGGEPTLSGFSTDADQGETIGGRGGKGGNNREAGHSSEYGGGGGGGGGSGYSGSGALHGMNGGSSLFGAGGGGGQGRFGGSAQGGQGGVWGSYTVGGNAATGTGDGADGVSRDFGCGNGGNGGGNDGYGGNGGIPGGGGGGGNATSGQGNGARGEVRIWAW